MIVLIFRHKGEFGRLDFRNRGGYGEQQAFCFGAASVKLVAEPCDYIQINDNAACNNNFGRRL